MSKYNKNIKTCYGSKFRTHLYKGRPVKFLVKNLGKAGGRNNLGRLTCATQGGGVKHFYRQVDFKRRNDNNPATVLRLEYDPNRTAFIALIEYEQPNEKGQKELSYILAPKDLEVGQKVISGTSVDIRVGNCMELEAIPAGASSFIHNIELQPGRGGVFGRSAGSKTVLIGKENGKAILRMNSGEIRYVDLKCRATIGIVSNEEHTNAVIGKAGRSRLLNRRPKNRGIARNPVDHPNGGRTSGGKVFRNKTGNVIKGARSRCKNKQSSKMIIRRRA